MLVQFYQIIPLLVANAEILGWNVYVSEQYECAAEYVVKRLQVSLPL